MTNLKHWLASEKTFPTFDEWLAFNDALFIAVAAMDDGDEMPARVAFRLAELVYPNQEAIVTLMMVVRVLGNQSFEEILQAYNNAHPAQPRG